MLYPRWCQANVVTGTERSFRRPAPRVLNALRVLNSSIYKPKSAPTRASQAYYLPLRGGAQRKT